LKKSDDVNLNSLPIGETVIFNVGRIRTLWHVIVPVAIVATAKRSSCSTTNPRM